MVVIIVLLIISLLSLSNSKLNPFFSSGTIPREGFCFQNILGAHTFLPISEEQTAFLLEYYETQSTSIYFQYHP